MYRVYLRSPDGIVQPYTKVATEDRAEAIQAFERLVNRTDLDGSENAVALTFNHNQIAYHRFDRRPGQLDYWRSRLEELPLYIVKGNKGTSAGRSHFVTVRLEVATVVAATEIGNGDLAAGLKLAVEHYQTPLLDILPTNEIRIRGKKTGLCVRQKGRRTIVYRPEAARQKYEELPMPQEHYALWGDMLESPAMGIEQFVEDLKVHLQTDPAVS